jgi:hypothetical protein
MKKNVMHIICCGMSLLVPLFLSAQIVIDYTEIPHVVNTRWTKNVAHNQTVSLGSVGGPQTWTFTSQPMGTDSCTDVVVPVSQMPFHDSFPNANLCYMSVDGSDSAFLYMRLVSSFLSTLGIAGEDSSGSMFIKYSPVDTNNLPEHFGDYRNYRSGWTYVVDASTYMRYQKTGLEYINAYGTVTVPYGSFPCLRYILFDTLIMTMYYNNVPIYADTSTNIGHQFVAENRSGVVCVFSQPDETNPYFTNAATLERLTYFYTGIEEETGGIARAGSEKIIEVRPNPFVDEVGFTCQKPGALEIYDATGKLVRNFPRSADRSAITWNGTDCRGTMLPAGVYFYRFDSRAQCTTGRIVLVK